MGASILGTESRNGRVCLPTKGPESPKQPPKLPQPESLRLNPFRQNPARPLPPPPPRSSPRISTAKRQELNLALCKEIPAAAWQLLATAEWPALKKADFAGRLGRGAKLAGALCLFVSFFCCGPHLPSPPCPGPRCFYENGKGAAELLGALGRCRELEDAADWVDVFLKAESPQLPFQTTHGCAGEDCSRREGLAFLRDVAVPKLAPASGVDTRLLVSPLRLGSSSRVETGLVEYSVSVHTVHAGMVPVHCSDSDRDVYSESAYIIQYRASLQKHDTMKR